MLSIDDSAYYVSETRLSVEENYERFSISRIQAKVFTKFYGLKQISYAKDMSMADLVCQPIQKILLNNNSNKKKIKFVIHAHTANVLTRFGRSVIREVKEKLELNDSISFGISLNNCASTINALEIAAMLLSSESKDAKGIIVCGETTFTPTVQVIPNTSIMGDASAAFLVSKTGNHDRLLHLEIKTEGKYSRGIWMNEEESKDFEKQYVPLLSETINNAVSHLNLKIHDIKKIIPHNVNLISWFNLAKEINYPLDRIYLKNISKYGHCFGSDIIINFSDFKDENKLLEGDYYMMVTVGLGATFAAAIFQH